MSVKYEINLEMYIKVTRYLLYACTTHLIIIVEAHNNATEISKRFS